MLWNVPDTTLEPEITLKDWQVYETETGECHLVGYCVEYGEGRVSSAIAAFDPVARCANTRSGRAYQLQGRPGVNDDADYVWQKWKRINSVVTAIEVSDRVWADIQDTLKALAS